MLLKNIDVTDGLVNGMVGTLMEVELNVDDTPKRVWLRCPSGEGTLTKAKVSYRSGVRRYTQWVPIEPITMSFAMKGKALRHVSVRRTQFPLVPASAMTIHKSQGGTFDTVVYDYANAHPQKLV
ncbi:hypothetical protein HPB50_010646 [Hyalomma asiaticum]|uniref:Uncharacterized protein n=1 Tax=Hyalomma asiaticum TaxID=266040 RepID=A0ACB7T253_HYAAI|nr:hypothetical protein HPB50_010646 [Hyalomma asiaticum]